MRLNEENISNHNASHNRWLVLKTSRGYEMGIPGGMLTTEQEEKYRTEAMHYEDTTESMLQEVELVREADINDIENYYMCRREEEDVLLKAREILSDHGLNMKLVDVEYILDHKRLYFYFTSEQRVDFRAYVRDLAHEFKTRIEMRQIGIRDEARIVRGIASCGRPCCCSYWLRGFEPISIKIVKEQRSALNPTKISGLCGRLMCCMSYEQELYSEMWSKLPGPGAKIKTEQGTYTLENLDVGNERVNIRFPSGRLVPVLVSEFPDFKEAVLNGEEWGVDKELAAKKKAAQERIERLEKAKQARRKIKVNAKSLRTSSMPPSVQPKSKAKSKSQSQSQNQDNKREAAHKKRRPRKQTAKKDTNGETKQQ